MKLLQIDSQGRNREGIVSVNTFDNTTTLTNTTHYLIICAAVLKRLFVLMFTLLRAVQRRDTGLSRLNLRLSRKERVYSDYLK